MRQKTTGRQQIGRPPGGVRDGEKVKDYPQVSLRLPPETHAKLAIMSKVFGQPQWRIVLDAVECYYQKQPRGERELADQLARNRVRSMS